MSLGHIDEPLPNGWRAPLLSELTTPKQWKTISTKSLLSEGYTVYGANGKIGYFDQYTHEHPTIMITCRGATCGNLHISEPFSYINGNAMALDGQPTTLVGLKFLYFALKARGLKDTISGSAQPQITGKGLSEVRLPLPPLAEQKVIADKLDTLLTQVGNNKARLERIPKILKRFRQSVLAAAVSGRLTEGWRTQNCYSAERQFNTLYEIERAYIEAGHKDERAKILKEKEKFRNRSITNHDKTSPEGWCSKPFFEMCLLNRGFDLPTSKRVDGDYPILSAGGEIGTHHEAKTLGPCITVGRSGSVGQVFFTEKDAWPLNTALYAKDIGFSISKFVFYKLKTMNLVQFASSTAVPTLNRNEFTHEVVDIPPREEQEEIVRQVDQFFAHADRIEQQVSNALARVNNLSQSILAKAFRGELTEQWRKDNPALISGKNSAEALLEKIKLEREKLNKQSKQKGVPVKKRIANKMSKEIIKVADALREADQPLSGQQLLAAAGYPIDSSTEELEKFFLDIRNALVREKRIVKLKRSDDSQDWFALAETTKQA